jgi:hypothetical protein
VSWNLLQEQIDDWIPTNFLILGHLEYATRPFPTTFGISMIITAREFLPAIDSRRHCMRKTANLLFVSEAYIAVEVVHPITYLRFLVFFWQHEVTIRFVLTGENTCSRSSSSPTCRPSQCVPVWPDAYWLVYVKVFAKAQLWLLRWLNACIDLQGRHLAQIKPSMCFCRSCETHQA